MSKKDFNPQSEACLICNSNKINKFKAYAYGEERIKININECKECTFAWQYPTISEFYESIKYFENKYSNNHMCSKSYFNKQFKKDISLLELYFIENLEMSDKKLLDVGAGDGTFAEAACERGWRVTAIDPAVNCNSIKSDIKIIKGTIDDLSDTNYDVITLWDVIEHIEHPVTLINKCNKKIKYGGWLVIETGNYKSADRVSSGMNHWIYQIDHKWFFSPESIEYLLRDAGFTYFVYSDRVLRPKWRGCVKYNGPSSIQLIKSIMKSPLLFYENINKYIYLMNKVRYWNKAGISIFTVAARFI